MDENNNKTPYPLIGAAAGGGIGALFAGSLTYLLTNNKNKNKKSNL